MAAEENASVFWKSFGDSSAFVEVECDLADNLASEVLIYYGFTSVPTAGGKLDNLDIKHMDALSIIKLSLLDSAAQSGELKELFIESDGKPEFREVGADNGKISDIYHTIQTMSYVEKCTGVLITGGKPLPYRKDMNWVNIWGPDKEVYDTDQMNKSACVSEVFNQWASIVFNDPHLDSSFVDGIDNLYEINSSNPYDNIIGYAYYSKIPDAYKDASVKLVKECSIPIAVGGAGSKPLTLGKLQRRLIVTDNLENAGCWYEPGVEGNINEGVEIEIPDKFRFESVRGVIVDKFKGISQIYIIGQEVLKYSVGAKSDSDAVVVNPGPGQCNLYVSIEDVSMKAFSLEQGKHYNIIYKGEEGEVKTPYVLFANGAIYESPADFGDNTTFHINKACTYYRNMGTPTDTITECFLPTSRDSGIIVNQIWAVADLDTWALKVHDPKGYAKEVVNSLTYLIAPIVEVAEPAPIAFNGDLLNMADSILDHDPTTSQDFENTEFELAVKEMSSGNGLTLNFSFLDENGIIKLSEVLYDYMNSGNGIETTYICGPNCKPVLGGAGNAGGIVNSITYSYSDNNSYTISINEGQKITTDFAQISGGVSMKVDEEISAQGTIIQDLGNSIHYKVRIDGFGERFAFSSCPEILRVGDIVNCSLHNIPVEA